MGQVPAPDPKILNGQPTTMSSGVASPRKCMEMMCNSTGMRWLSCANFDFRSVAKYK